MSTAVWSTSKKSDGSGRWITVWRDGNKYNTIVTVESRWWVRTGGITVPFFQLFCMFDIFHNKMLGEKKGVTECLDDL